MDKAKECFNWLQTYMYDPSDHLYYDNASPKDDDPTQVGNIEKNKYSYNSGQPLQLACLLYKITQENSYLNLAKQIAEACHNKWFKQFHSDILKRDFKVLSPGHAWFNTIMCRGFSNSTPLTRTHCIWKIYIVRCYTPGLAKHIIIMD